MSRTVKWSTATGLVVVLMTVAAWFLLISPKRAEAARLHDEKVAQDAANDRLRRQVAKLKVQAKGLPKQQERLAEIATKLPPAPELPTLARQLDRAAKTSGVTTIDLNPSIPVSLEPASAGTGATTPGPKGAVTPAGKSTGRYLQEIPVGVRVVGTLAQLQTFLKETEEIRRAFRNTRVTVRGDIPGRGGGRQPSTGKLVLELNAHAFMVTPLPPATAAAGPTAPATGR